MSFLGSPEMITLVATSVWYFSQGDEDSFFSWLKSIQCVSGVHGAGRDLFIEISTTNVSNADLIELIALFYRYDVDMRQLRQMLTEQNAAWFRDQEKFWHDKVFGSA
ncbi:hypothetical protein [Steroidobacter cummioxidans]|uniref:hypothetical protein n=1 Tax=Steroidobacter cummioxidans TaxID=1803913 RepID=UPI000E31B07A|nr:hypothetical protein [Steroidobacter cummioxidans]